MVRDYVYDQGFVQERERLAGIESLWDPGTQALLDELGVTRGSRCLEVGAGAGRRDRPALNDIRLRFSLCRRWRAAA